MNYDVNKEEKMSIPVDVECLMKSIREEMIEREVCLRDAVAEFEKSFVDMIMEKVDGDINRATNLLTINRRTLNRIINSSGKRRT